MAERAKIADIPELDVSGFPPKQPPAKPPLDEIRAASEKAGLVSREPRAKPVKTADRRHRTGRDIQLATKVDQDTKDLLYAIYDDHRGKGKENWTIGQIIGFGLQAFQRELKAKS